MLVKITSSKVNLRGEDMTELIQIEKEEERITMIRFVEPLLTEEFKRDLARVRKEVNEGKFTRYNNAKELADELGL